MKKLLIEISQKAIKYEDFNFTEEQIENNWLGNFPTTEKQIIEVETKLGLKLPEFKIKKLQTPQILQNRNRFFFRSS
jgi:hypothetical protein